MPYENSPSLRLLEIWTGKDRTSIEPSQKAKSRAGRIDPTFIWHWDRNRRRRR